MPIIPGGRVLLLGAPPGRVESLDAVELLGLSRSIVGGTSVALLLLCLRCLFDDAVAFLAMEDAPGPGVVFGGAAAMGTTPLPPMAATAPLLPKWLLGVVPAVLPPEPGPALAGLSPSLALPARTPDGGVTAC